MVTIYKQKENYDFHRVNFKIFIWYIQSFVKMLSHYKYHSYS